MSMTVAAATARLAREMPVTETAIDDALVASASLLLTAATARRDTGVRAVETHSALLRISKLNQTLIEASAEAVRAHTQLRKLHQEVTDGPADDCPDFAAPSAIRTLSA